MPRRAKTADQNQNSFSHMPCFLSYNSSLEMTLHLMLLSSYPTQRAALSKHPHNKVTVTLTRHSGENRNPEESPGYRLAPV